ncbi:chemotaxis response regulator protein [Candidatus Photodesmus katoptron]|uniref:protein-glutamate methylesterase/protein-glutamine glutaminase n=1 Tax=Candidatus Photodesmus anomalopis TaxID=28176 RepID=UPI0004D5B723|nr:chemotaxis response regulator protein-glutamate methylesterase [Candidatus Photodesmus katoptron]KEY90576.1 chemotaxis response regulator protein [Candidatus Photodesmus katoptron]
MSIKVLVVDDSSFFRRRVTEIINSGSRLEVIGLAVNGKDAIEKAKLLKPDVITMDIEMPVMNGIVAVKEIMAECPTPILMFSSLTYKGATATLDALDAGALDFLPKNFWDITRNYDKTVDIIQNRIIQISYRKNKISHSSVFSSSLVSKTKTFYPFMKSPGKIYQLTVIGTSTGGPIALQKILTKLPANYPHPIVLVQHMPASFTTTFANRLNSLCKIQVKEAEHGDLLCPGIAYLAPGGKQMLLDGNPRCAKVKVISGKEEMNYKPCVDITFSSIAKVYSGKVLSMLLTGMGVDGYEGARILKTTGATIWAQDEESCVVYGMPQAVAKAGISTENLPLDFIATRMLIELGMI